MIRRKRSHVLTVSFNMITIIYFMLLMALNFKVQSIEDDFYLFLMKSLKLSILGVLLFVVVSYIDLGYFDPFLVISVPVLIMLGVFTAYFKKFIF